MNARAVVLLIVSTGGCVRSTGPTTVVATGEQLAVVDDLKVWTTTSREKVGQTVHKDSAGSTIGTSDTYADRTRVHSAWVWFGVQGAQQLRDEDFFRIAGDDEALAQTLAMRDEGNRKIKRGWLVLGISGGAIVAGAFAPREEITAVTTLAGLIGMTVGGYMVVAGMGLVDPERHAVDRSVAERAARSYNQNVGGLGVSRRF